MKGVSEAGLSGESQLLGSAVAAGIRVSRKSLRDCPPVSCCPSLYGFVIRLLRASTPTGTSY